VRGRPWIVRALACLAAALISLVTSGARAGDPYLRWYTIVTPHFRVHYHGGLEEAAQKVANVAEHAHRELVPELGWKPQEVTHIVLSDDSDFANGLASTTPYDYIRLFVSSPDDMSLLSDYDDWLVELVTHEYTHILHIDNASGVASIVNAIFGKTLVPNQLQPRWILEGLAVAMESRHTTAGRLRSTQVDMFLRADVLGGRLARLDQISHPARRWPAGNLWYLYGAKFVEWISSVYGPETFGAVASDYGASVIPWGINRAIRRATGRTYEELYQGWQLDLEQRYAAQAAAVRRRGLREGQRLTMRGRQAAAPRYLPASCSNGRTVYYLRDDGDTTAGIYRVDLDDPRADDNAVLVAASSGKDFSFDAHCNLIFDHIAPTRRRYYFHDLYRLDQGQRAPTGLERNRRRLTTGRRAREPDVSPDGRFITYVTHQAGTSTLRLAELTPEGAIVKERRLVASARYEQAYTPIFSPDGKRIVYGAWTTGGFRDLRIVDIEKGTYVSLWRDRALDQQPAWSPDGKTLYFTSDRSGIANVYAYDVATRQIAQVTNVITGAYHPAPSPDGKTLVYVGYSADGFDLFSMPLDPERYLDAAEPVAERALPGATSTSRYPVEPYNPLPSLTPRQWSLTYGQGTFGNAIIVSAVGGDAVGHHAVGATATFETEYEQPQLSFDYIYGRLPFAYRTSLFRGVAPRGGYRIGETEQTVIETFTGATTGVSMDFPGDAEYQTASFSYTLARYDANLPVGTRGDPWAPIPVEPHRGWLGLLRLGYGFSNVSGTADAISAERGLSLNLGADFADPAWGSDNTLTAFSGSLSTYWLLPWGNHHVAALALSGGAAVGNYPRYGIYATGGYADTPAFDAFTSGLRQSSFVLRGYLPGQFAGTQYNLVNAEYRFPILYADRGVSTLPVFLRTISGAAFADWGGAYNELDLEDPLASYHLGVGAELWFELVIGYFAGANLRLGVARGLDDEAPPGLQTYFVASSAF
jgi:Tol biopolymer transport system component